jgi:dTDP-4-dehydrorhamnose 3,5-epimerase
MTRFTVTNLPLPGLKLVERRCIGDDRGFLSRLFCTDDLSVAGWSKPIAQINHTHTLKRGTVRGLHFQKQIHAEMKLVTCLNGSVWDVAVDLRANSPTFLKWHAEFLSAKNCRALLIPEGFAHGFQAQTDNVDLIYLHSVPHEPKAEGGFNVKDALLDIRWPLPITNLSKRDAAHPRIEFEFKGVHV